MDNKMAYQGTPHFPFSTPITNKLCFAKFLITLNPLFDYHFHYQFIHVHSSWQFQQSGDLNYVDVEFTKPKKKKKSKKDKESGENSDVPQPSVEYSEVIVQNSKPSLKGWCVLNC